ncbi:portal vertex protein of head [Listeria phage LIS04]|nr:portal vertex protein of head [Listeria phage LIS04]
MKLLEVLGVKKVADIGQKDRNIPADLDEALQKVDSSSWETVKRIRDLSGNRVQRYNEYNAMAEDVFIAAALELYADDAVQSHPRTGKAVWITSENDNLVKDLELLLSELDIESRLWDWAHELAKYGSLPLKLFRDGNDVLEKYVEEVTDPAKVVELQYKGRTEYFGISNSEETNTHKKETLVLEPSNSYVNFLIRKANKFEDLTMDVPILGESGDQEEIRTETRTFKVAEGVSILEPLRSSYRILKLLEDSLIAARLSRSAMIRMFSLEVGASASPKEAREMVNRFKKLIDTREEIDVREGSYNSKKSPGPIDDPIIVPTRNGKGNVSFQNIGGDVEVRSIVDIDYFRNKVFAGLKIPKAFLGFEEFLPGGFGQSPLTKLDVRYARTVKRVQTALKEGIRKLLNLYLIDQNRRGEVNSFTVNMTEPSSSEESDRMNDLGTRLNLVDALLRMLDSEGTREMFDKYDLVQNLLSNVLKFEDLEAAMVTKAQYEKSMESQSVENEEIDSDF